MIGLDGNVCAWAHSAVAKGSNSSAKARRKGADLLAVNAVGERAGFGDVPNAVTVLDAAGEVVGEVAGSKDDVARGLVDLVAARLGVGGRD